MRVAERGEREKYRTTVPENQEETIQLFIKEVAYFESWAKNVDPEWKKSLFWECDYEEQLYLDTALELLFKNCLNLEDIASFVIEKIIYIIARNHEQGNILAWQYPNIHISYLGMSIQQFHFLAEKIVEKGETNAKFQIAIVYKKLNSISRKDLALIQQLAKDEDEYVTEHGLRSLKFWENRLMQLRNSKS